MIFLSFLIPSAVTTTSLSCLLSAFKRTAISSPVAVTCWLSKPIKLINKFSPLTAEISKDPSCLVTTVLLELFAVMVALSTGEPLLASTTFPLMRMACALIMWEENSIATVSNNSFRTWELICFINQKFRFENTKLPPECYVIIVLILTKCKVIVNKLG